VHQIGDLSTGQTTPSTTYESVIADRPHVVYDHMIQQSLQPAPRTDDDYVNAASTNDYESVDGVT